MIFSEPVAGPPNRNEPVSGGRYCIINWQATYTDEGRTIVRDIALPKGRIPPLKAQYDGRVYHRFAYSVDRLSCCYTWYREDQK